MVVFLPSAIKFMCGGKKNKKKWNSIKFHRLTQVLYLHILFCLVNWLKYFHISNVIARRRNMQLLSKQLSFQCSITTTMKDSQVPALSPKCLVTCAASRHFRFSVTVSLNTGVATWKVEVEQSINVCHNFYFHGVYMLPQPWLQDS